MEEKFDPAKPKIYPLKVNWGKLDRWHRAARKSGYKSTHQWMQMLLDRESTRVLTSEDDEKT